MLKVWYHLLILNLKLCQSVLYEKGVYSEFNNDKNTNFACQDGETHSGGITFTTQFQNVPKFIVTLTSYYTNQEMAVNFEISETTLTQSQFNIKCQGIGKVLKYVFAWVAIQSNDIYVMNLWFPTSQCPDENCPLSYPNPYPAFTQILPSITSFDKEVFVYINNLNLNSKTINFSIRHQSVIGNVGLQLILWLKGALTLFIGDENQYCSYLQFQSSGQTSTKTLSIGKNIFIQPLFVASFIIPKFKFTQTFNNDQVSYYVENFQEASVYFGWSDATINIDYQNNPIQLRKLRVSKSFSYDFKFYTYFWQLQITDYNINYHTPQTFQIEIGQFQDFNFKYTFECQPNYKIEGQALRCQNCIGNDQFQKFSHYCYQDINLLLFYFNFDIVSIGQKIDIILTDNNFMISQTFGSQTYLILNLDVKYVVPK